MKGDDRPSFAANQAIEKIAIEQRMRGPAPDRRAIKLVLLDQVFRPADPSSGSVEAKEIAHGAQRIDAVLVNQRSGAWSAGIRDRIGAVVLVLPEKLAVGGAQTQNTLFARNTFAR